MSVRHAGEHVGRGDAIELTVDGKGEDGKPLTFTFSGRLDQDAPSDRCARVLGQ
jgi:hypothetical protein